MERFSLPIVYVLLTLFVVTNVYFSITHLEPLGYGLTSRNFSDVVRFLKEIRYTEFFTSQYKTFDIYFGGVLRDEVYMEDDRINEEIAHLESLLQQNPYARDVLVSLAQLYARQEKHSRAREYLDRAVVLDPQISLVLEDIIHE